MKYKIKPLKVAQNDLKDIREFLSHFYPNTKRNFLQGLKKQFHLLEDMPLMCEEYHDDPFYRRMVVGDYLVFYHIDDGSGTVEIHRILHGSRDIRQYI